MRLLAAILAAALAGCGSSEPDVAREAASPAPRATLDDDPGKPGRTHVSFTFEELDLNDDGAIAKSESAFDTALSERFARWDHDGDGALSRLEFDVARAAQHAARK